MWKVVAMCVFCSSCAWLFQDHLPSEYSGRSEPMCSTSNGWALVDGIFATLNLIGIVGAATDEQASDEEKSAYIVGGVLGGIIHVASAGTGVGWATDCKNARVAFDNKDGTVRREVTTEPIEAPRAAPIVVPAPRGYFCSLSAANLAAGFCVRDKGDCERTRDVSIAALPDLTQCGLVEAAWCVSDLCFPTQEACDARRTRTQIETPCTEQN